MLRFEAAHTAVLLAAAKYSTLCHVRTGPLWPWCDRDHSRFGQPQLAAGLERGTAAGTSGESQTLSQSRWSFEML